MILQNLFRRMQSLVMFMRSLFSQHRAPSCVWRGNDVGWIDFACTSIGFASSWIDFSENSVAFAELSINSNQVFPINAEFSYPSGFHRCQFLWKKELPRHQLAVRLHLADWRQHLWRNLDHREEFGVRRVRDGHNGLSARRPIVAGNQVTFLFTVDATAQTRIINLVQ